MVEILSFLKYYSLVDCLFLKMKNECNFAVEMLDNSNMNSFPCLFLTKVSFLQQFDHYIK